MKVIFNSGHRHNTRDHFVQKNGRQLHSEGGGAGAGNFWKHILFNLKMLKN